MGWDASSSRMRLPWSPCGRGKNGLVPGTRRNLPSSALPPAEVPVVSPSMKYAAACSCDSLATAGMMFSFQFRISRRSTVPTVRASR